MFSNVSIRVPPMGDSVREGTLSKWMKNVGDVVATDEVIAQIETDKITVDIRSSASGVVSSLFAKSGDTVEVGKALAEISPSTSSDGVAMKSSTPQPSSSSSSPPVSARPTAATPSAEVKSEAVLKTMRPSPPQEAKRSTGSAAAVDLSFLKSAVSTESAVRSSAAAERRVPMSRMRLRIAERMKEAQNMAAQLTTFNEVDMTSLMRLKSDLSKEFESSHRVKLGFVSGFVAAATNALLKMPVVNAFIDGKEIVYRDYVDVGVAVATPNGLVVPVLRDCQKMGIAAVEKELFRLAERARKGELTIADMQGGTFTLSNGGVFGSLFGTPILNPPQSAILGMHGIVNRPVAVLNKVEIRPMMYVALTYDHRLIDGREAALFLKRVKSLVEDPRRLLLDA